LFSGQLLGRHEVSYFECQTCGYVQTEDPHWLEEAYREPINVTDTGILRRNIVNARIVQATMLVLPDSSAPVVDFAGGYGLLVRQLRDAGVNALWRDQYCTNLLAKGFEHHDEPASLATAFEVFEHFVDPLEEARKIAELAPTILLSTELMPDRTPEPQAWWYYGLDHGQHIGFFRMRSLEYLAGKLGRTLISDGASYHLITSEKVNAGFWKFLKRWNSFISLKNRMVRSSLTESDFQNLLRRTRT
jgi:hypothetical protein